MDKSCFWHSYGRGNFGINLCISEVRELLKWVSYLSNKGRKERNSLCVFAKLAYLSNL